MNNELKYGSKTFDLFNQGSFQCIAVAKTEKIRDDFLKRAYWVMFSPEEDGTNCWVMVREKSETQEYFS